MVEERLKIVIDQIIAHTGVGPDGTCPAQNRRVAVLTDISRRIPIARVSPSDKSDSSFTKITLS